MTSHPAPAARNEARLVAPGWQVHGWAGDRVGEVVKRQGDLLTVRLNSIAADEVSIPTSLISAEDESSKRATLSVDTSELDGVEPLLDGVGLVDGTAEAADA